MMRNLLLIICLGLTSLLYAQKEAPDVRRGNQAYKQENYTEAEVDYRRGLDKNASSFQAQFNLADALFKASHIINSSIKLSLTGDDVG